MTNYLESALSNPNRNDASRRLSTKIAAVPKLLVEGKFDRTLLKRKWCTNRDEKYQIDVIKPNGGKDEVIFNFKKGQQDPLLFALVDMDYDFEGESLTHERIIDTRPLVTLATHYFTDQESTEILIQKIVSKYSEHFEKKLNNEILEYIQKIAKIKTWIKLFKGSCNVTDRNMSIKWNEINKDLNQLVLLQDHLAELIFYDNALEKKFKIYVEENIVHLQKCGINDHMLIDSICLWFGQWDSKFNNRLLEKDYFRPQIIKKACDQNGDFAEHLRQKILTLKHNPADV